MIALLAWQWQSYARKAIGRLFLEQWPTVRRFVISGGWARNFTGC